jgi:type IV secretion system protein VirB2
MKAAISGGLLSGLLDVAVAWKRGVCSRWWTGFLVLICSTPAFAQFERAKQGLTTVQTFLIGIGVVIATIAILLVGFKMMYRKTPWDEVSHVFWGGLIAGSAVAIASWFFGS